MDELTQGAAILKLHFAFDESEEAVVMPTSDVGPWFERGASLAHQYGSGCYELAVEPLDSKTFRLTIPSISGASETFFVCHEG